MNYVACLWDGQLPILAADTLCHYVSEFFVCGALLRAVAVSPPLHLNQLSGHQQEFPFFGSIVEHTETFFKILCYTCMT
jgi:hypothetical protein